MGFEGKPFVSVTQGAGDIENIKPADAPKEEIKADEATEKLIAGMKAALGDKVKDVRVSKRLTESAVCLVNDAMLDRNLERMLSRQKDSGVTVSAPVLEINQNHALIKALARSSDVNDAAHLLLDQAFILEGEQVADPAGFAKRLGDVMARAFA
jgi:molecular chaperone HtpG